MQVHDKTAGNIWVLSIGINEYKNPGITNLQASVSDVYRLRDFLQSRYSIPKSRYRTLINGQATRKGIIDTFRSHFRQVKDGDTVLLHYSGHGSWERAPEAFAASGLEPPGGRNETIVCFDSGDPGVYNIADKEIRYLISEMQYADHKKRPIQVVCLFDCCHSGSMLRNIESAIKIRRHEPTDRKASRPLPALLEGQYAGMEDLHLPPVDYISISACSPFESAAENAEGGIFTTSLLQVLASFSKEAPSPSYVTLFALVKTLTQHHSGNYQTPYFEYTGQVNPYAPFLVHGASPDHNLPLLIKKSQRWQLEVGAIHGLNLDSFHRQQIPIFSQDRSHLIGYGIVDSVGLESSVLRNVEFLPGQRELPSRSVTVDYFHAGVHWSPLPIKVIEKDPDLSLPQYVNSELLQPERRERFLLSDMARYELLLTSKELLLYKTNLPSREFIYGIRQTDRPAVAHIFDQLSKIALWELLHQIYTPKHTKIDPKRIELDFSYIDQEGKLVRIPLDPQEQNTSASYQINLPFDPAKGAIPYTFTVTNHSGHALYYYLIHLDRKYNIFQKHEAYLKGFYDQETTLLYDSARHRRGLGISRQDHAREVVDTFLLVASEEQLHIPYAFEQQGFGNCYGQVVDSLADWQVQCAPEKKKILRSQDDGAANWVVKRMEVRLWRF